MVSALAATSRYKATHGGFLGPLCTLGGPSPPPGPAPAPPPGVAISWRGQACLSLVATAPKKKGKVGLAACATPSAHGWAVAYDGLVSYSEWVLRPTNPPKTPASCKAGTSVMVGSSPAGSGIKLSQAGGGKLVSSACEKESLCVVGGGVAPVLGSCASPLATGWNMSTIV
jgi:hypothetical protein